MAAKHFISRSRVFILFGVSALLWLALIGRLVQIQIVNGSRYAEISDGQVLGKVEVPAERGRLIDANGRLLASNLPCRSYFAYPETKDDAIQIAHAVASVFGESRRGLERKLSDKLNRFTWLHRKAEPSLAAKLNTSEITGLFAQTELQRIYPNSGLGQDLIGMVNIDNVGISGLEYALNPHLAGQDGLTVIERDAYGRVYRLAGREVLPPRNGCDVSLTIDLDWQSILEEELAAGVKEYGAQSGVAVYLKPDDGAVLAIASYSEKSRSAKSMKNEAIADVFEPGSVFKLITASAVLEEGAVNFKTVIDCDSGVSLFSGKRIRDDKKWGDLEFFDVIRYSSNIGTAKAACKLGARQLYRYAKDFGFGTKTGIDLPGEQGGMLREPEVWSDHFTASLAMGHGVSVNALQLAAAFNVVPSHGALYQPYIIREIVSADGKVQQVGEPHKVRQLLSEETCRRVAELMSAVVDSGTAKYARTPEVSFAGKTGTAQKPNLETGGYYQNRYMSSFAGWFPQEKPIAVAVIVLDDPQPLHYAGMTAGRIFARVAARVAALEGLPRPRDYAADSSFQNPEMVVVPDLVGESYDTTSATLAGLNLKIETANEGELIIAQQPAAGKVLSAGEPLLLFLGSEAASRSDSPDNVVGLSLRQALAKLSQQGYEVEIKGSGLVRCVEELESHPDGGGKRCRLICSID
ncbi:MAG: penicillin-binding transpeptidase domain-containing protein [bacterium]